MMSDTLNSGKIVPTKEPNDKEELLCQVLQNLRCLGERVAKVSQSYPHSCLLQVCLGKPTTFPRNLNLQNMTPFLVLHHKLQSGTRAYMNIILSQLCLQALTNLCREECSKVLFSSIKKSELGLNTHTRDPNVSLNVLYIPQIIK